MDYIHRVFQGALSYAQLIGEGIATAEPVNAVVFFTTTVVAYSVFSQIEKRLENRERFKKLYSYRVKPVEISKIALSLALSLYFNSQATALVLKCIATIGLTSGALIATVTLVALVATYSLFSLKKWENNQKINDAYTQGQKSKEAEIAKAFNAGFNAQQNEALSQIAKKEEAFTSEIEQIKYEKAGLIDEKKRFTLIIQRLLTLLNQTYKEAHSLWKRNSSTVKNHELAKIEPLKQEIYRDIKGTSIGKMQAIATILEAPSFEQVGEVRDVDAPPPKPRTAKRPPLGLKSPVATPSKQSPKSIHPIPYPSAPAIQTPVVATS